jgi:hypothetical protein
MNYRYEIIKKANSFVALMLNIQSHRFFRRKISLKGSSDQFDWHIKNLDNTFG